MYGTPIDTTLEDISYPHSNPPEPGEMIEVTPGVYWVRMPMPIALDHINLWLIEDGDEWVVVDTGYGTDLTCELWERIFAGPARSRKPGRLICTHHHPDHFGQAGWLTRRYGMSFHMSEKEWLVGTLLARMSDEAYAEGQDRFYREHGVPADLRRRLHAIGNEYRNRILAPPDRFERLRDCQRMDIGGHQWRLITLEGHSEELIGLHCADLNVFISGDQILPKITPNISVHWFKDGSEPLADYLHSLDRMASALPAETLVLPSHKLPMYGAHRRIIELQNHHDERLFVLTKAIKDDTPRTAFDLLPTLFPRALEDEHVMFALGECVAHLAHLVRDGSVAVEPDTTGTLRYRGH